MNAIELLSLNHEQCAAAIQAGGEDTTTLVEGPPGWGKTALLYMLANTLPTHAPVYFDCTTKDLGDLIIPAVDPGASCFKQLPNEEFGLHSERPVIFMADEIGKANPSVKNGMMRFLLEGKIGNQTLPKGSLRFATTNMMGDGLGDRMLAHHLNRITRVMLLPPDHLKWIEWGLLNNIDHTLLGWCRDNPQLFDVYTKYKDPEENPYIFHPRANARTAFVTGRSLAKASGWLKQRAHFDTQTLKAVLAGTVGIRAALDLEAFVGLADKLPRLEDIKARPGTTVVPDSAAALCMVVYRTLSCIDRTWVDAWMEYLCRLPVEAQGIFVNSVMTQSFVNSPRGLAVTTNREFGQWALANRHLSEVDNTAPVAAAPAVKVKKVK